MGLYDAMIAARSKPEVIDDFTFLGATDDERYNLLL